MRWLPVVLLLMSCETNEVLAWTARRTELESRREALEKLETKGHADRVGGFRSALDFPGFVRTHGVSARVFREPGLVRVTASGAVQECHDVVASLAEVRWLTQDWRLRLEKGRCEWEARTGADFTTLESALLAPPTKWSAPAPQFLSRDVSELKKAVQGLEADIHARELKLGDLAVLEGRLDEVQPLVESLRARPAPCDLAVLDRELALDAADQGKLLEVESSRLVHPLEPRSDFRLRGLVEVHDGSLAWRCEVL